MIDLHSHILPGVDDGAQTLEDSLEMARKAISQGITHLMCTPHHNNGKYNNPADKIIRDVAALQKELDQRGLDLTLLEGQEVRLTEYLLTAIKREEILFTDLDNTYLLIEFPTNEIPIYAEQVFYHLLSQGHVPVIVHPERNAVFREEPNRLVSFLEMGTLTQLTAPSIVGIFGSEIQKTARLMLEHQMLYMVASDAHNLRHRTFLMKEAYEEIQKIGGREMVAAMQQMAKDLVNGDSVVRPMYQAIK
ncbi:MULTISPECIES: tyrosine-protein phosphatase [Enterococcus]|uniref:tyrosine-protein phosphatase n=1 Tax=Enterococcus TaxID=1350 RepID=UPI0008CA6BCB|nr:MULTISPECIES: CpsB/CapC family capsule biosynthesis tyrosine phosphatase [Enterococcus]SES96736.1 protein-tyrosine phosphatase [Enterococcus malodoratus]HCM85206.1 tyrosine protein phosphatase [Enterococcus sp.]